MFIGNSKITLRWGICIFAILLYMFIVLKLWNFNLSTPYTYEKSDDLYYATIAKSVMTGNSYFSNSLLAAPYGQNMHSFPLLMFFFTMFCRIIGFCGGSWIMAVNMYYLLCYILPILSFAILCKEYEINNPYIITMISLAYSFCQYHAWRSFWHYTAEAYYVVPLVLLIALLIYKNNANNFKIIILSIIIGITDIYYAFFGCYLLCIFAVYYIISKSWKKLLLSIFSVISIFCSVALCELPSLIVKFNGEYASTATRTPEEAYRWGLEIVSLFMPRINSVSVFSNITEILQQYPTFYDCEKYINYVGLLGIMGVACSIYNISQNRMREKYIAILNKQMIAMLLLGVTGGFGVLVAVLMTSKIRCYTRIMPYVFAMLLLIVGVYAEKNFQKHKIFLLLYVLLFLLHTYDMSIWRSIPDYAENSESYNRDLEFIESIELKLNNGDMVLQLPVIPAYENYVNGIGNCNYLSIGYLLCDKEIGWSYGAMAGTDEYTILTSKYVNVSVRDLVNNAILDAPCARIDVSEA